MMFKRMIVLCCLLLLPFTALAQDEDGGRIYVIKKGDTLWGVSERFIKDPDYWPSLWANNPEIRNPHFLYPGQKINIYDGRVEIVPAPPAAVTAGAPLAPATGAAPEAVQAVPPAEVPAAVTVRTLGGARGFVSQEELADAGILVDTVDNRIMMAAGEAVFVKMRDPAVARGTKFSLYETGREVRHPVTGKPVGFQVTELGAVQITEAGPEVATAQVVTSFREIQRGSLLLPYQPPVMEIALKRATQPLSGHLVAAAEGKIALSQHDVIHVDLGAADGLEVGNLLYVSRQRVATEMALGGEELQLPDVLLGTAVVLETRPHSASALILKSANPMYRGDLVTAVTE